MRLALACIVAGCTSSGGLEIDLSMPAGDLRPSGMTTISLIASAPGMAPITSTSPMGDMRFSAGEMPEGTHVELAVELRDVSNRLVGYGEATAPVDIAVGKMTATSVPVRRPFVYAADDVGLYSFDPTVDPRSPGSQGKLAGVTAPAFVVSIGATLVVASASALQLIDTATNMPAGASIAIPGTIHDLAAAGDKVVVAYDAGVAVVDLASTSVTPLATMPVDRVTFADGVVYGLVGRVAPPVGPFDPCTGTSSIVAIDLATGTSTPISVPPLADIAASGGAVFGAAPCANEVVRVDGTTVTSLFGLERAAAVVARGDRVFAVGSHPAVPNCGNMACTAAATATCPPTGTVQVSYVTEGAALRVVSAALDGTPPVTIDMPEQRETMVSTDDPAHQHTEEIHPLTTEPLDLVVLPDGHDIALVAKSTYFLSSLYDVTTGTVILPCMTAATGDWRIQDFATASTANRVRTQCTISVQPGTAIFQNWACSDPAPAEVPMQGMFVPASVGALYGAR